jgi:hypothetical protein
VIIDTINQWINTLLEASAAIVTPDWATLVDLIPVLLLIGVVGPMLTLLALLWLRYGARKPRTRVAFRDARRPAAVDEAGNLVFPVGEPYSLAEGMIYEPGATRSASGEPLLVACPKCSLARPAEVDTCGNCWLSFTLKPTTRSVRRATPPSGGAAAA